MNEEPIPLSSDLRLEELGVVGQVGGAVPEGELVRQLEAFRDSQRMSCRQQQSEAEGGKGGGGGGG